MEFKPAKISVWWAIWCSEEGLIKESTYESVRRKVWWSVYDLVWKSIDESLNDSVREAIKDEI